MHQDAYTHIHRHHPPIINHTFDHRPPFPHGPHRPPMPPPNPKTWAYYGSWESYRPFIETNQFSNATPGVTSGLFNPDGPLNMGNAQMQTTFLTNVSTTANFSLSVTFNYTNEIANKTVELTVGNIYNVTYLENGDIKKCSGKCSDIWKVIGTDNSVYYKIKFDCSVNYSNQVVVIKNDQIRDLSVYTGYEGVDTTISNGKHSFGTSCGTISDAIITNATVDAAGNIIEGDIINGTLDGYTVDGIATGTNNSGTTLTVINGKTIGGKITGGKILAGIFRSGSINGNTEEDTNITVKADVQGIIGNAIIMDATVEGGTTSDGTAINTTIEDGILYNAEITGEDMVTTNGITVGNITTGGVTTGGTGTGGTMVGVIDGKVYYIDGGTSKSKSNKTMTTSGGVVIGGTIIGGVDNGATIVGAVVKGGICVNGVTLNAITSGGTIIPTPSAPLPVTKNAYVNPNYSELRPNRPPINYNRPGNNPMDSDDLVIAVEKANGHLKETNFGYCKMQGIDNLEEKPSK